MRLNQITVRDFRNIERADLTLAPGINVLWGPNAQGKTNLLEAVHFLVTGRSFRARRESECVRWGEDADRAASVRGEMVRAGATHTIQVAVQGARRRIEIDRAPITKLAELWGKLCAVLFTPDDLQIVKGPPALRRRFLDIAISQVRPAYLIWLQRYQAALRERTALVRAVGNGQRSPEEIDAWDATLAEAGAEILGHRRDVIRRLEALAGSHCLALSGQTEALRLVHRSWVETQGPVTREECLDLLRRRLREARDDDIDRGQTSVGPHRDDVWIFLGDVDARVFASQGQQRAVTLALRLAEVALVEQETGEPPLLLLDDIISEFDPERRRRFFSLLRPEIQTIVTAVEPPSELEGVDVGQVISVRGGVFTPLAQDDAPAADAST
jgi:DNA replication and repair protein RecF